MKDTIEAIAEIKTGSKVMIQDPRNPDLSVSGILKGVDLTARTVTLWRGGADLVLSYPAAVTVPVSKKDEKKESAK